VIGTLSTLSSNLLRTMHSVKNSIPESGQHCPLSIAITGTRLTSIPCTFEMVWGLLKHFIEGAVISSDLA
jgi:hypothetical protein